MLTHRKVFLFVLYSVVLYLLISVAAIIFHFKWMPFQKVNLIFDITTTKDTTEIPDTNAIIIPVEITDKPNENFNLYTTPHLITSFNADTSKPSLSSFAKKLYELKAGKKTKIRIAYFGDSMIEGDLLTQTLRKLLQQTFGGSGVGYVPITSQVSKFRQTVIDNYSDGWQDDNFKTSGNGSRLYLSGHLFRSNGDWVQMKDQTITDSAAIIEKSLLCGESNPVNISVNNNQVTVDASNMMNRIVLDKSKSTGIKLSVANEQLPIYGISFESDSGIFVDNFSFRGITGIEFSKIDSSFLRSVAMTNPYDLIIFQYGVNLLFRPNDKNFSWYGRTLMPVIKKFKSCFNTADLLVVSTADRAFRYGGEYRSAIGIDSLIKVQALLAFESGSCFYNQFESMGGTNSIVEWAARNPSLANKDYVHPNHRGAEVLGNYFYEAIMNDFEKYIKTKKPE